MKKFAALLVLFAIMSTGARAACPVIAPVSVISTTGSAASLAPFFGAVTFGALIVYFNAAAVNFPLCDGKNKCSYSYPTDTNGR